MWIPCPRVFWGASEVLLGLHLSPASYKPRSRVGVRQRGCGVWAGSAHPTYKGWQNRWRGGE